MKYLSVVFVLFLNSMMLHADTKTVEWVMHYKSWSNWGSRGDVWINSDMKYAFNNAESHSDIPCTGMLDLEQYKDLELEIRKILLSKPAYSKNDTSENCNDEPRADIRIFYAPEGTNKKEIKNISERFSLMMQCNAYPIDKSWELLTAEIEAFASRQVPLCSNSPFE